MRKPYDTRYLDTMVQVASDLLEEFHPTLAYTQSDEISLVFPPCTVNERGNMSECIYSGQVQKVRVAALAAVLLFSRPVARAQIASLTAAFASARFNHHMSRHDFTDKEARLKERMCGGTLTFDARVFNVPDKEVALRNILWRSNFDCRRNSVAALGAVHLKGRCRLNNLSTRDILIRLREHKIEWSATPDRFKYGTFLKKEKYMRNGTDPRTGEPVSVMRTRVVPRSFRTPTNPLRGVPLLFSKYWDEYDEACARLAAEIAAAAGIAKERSTDDAEDAYDDEMAPDVDETDSREATPPEADADNDGAPGSAAGS